MTRRRGLGALLLLLMITAFGCSIRKLAVSSLADALASGGSSYATDDDPELVAAATPFGLKTIESLLAEAPTHQGLLLAATSGFVQYGYAFVQQEADLAEAKDLTRATALRARAKNLYLRALRYGQRGLEAAHRGFGADLRKDREAALSKLSRADVPVLYWTAAAWAAAISIAKDDSELTADLGLAAAMMSRALALDEGFGNGAIHDFFISYDGGRPESAGGSRERARRHLTRAIEISRGQRAAPLVAFAETVCVGAQDRKEFERLLNQALAIDVNKVPGNRLANLISQRRARWLLSRADELFLE